MRCIDRWLSASIEAENLAQMREQQVRFDCDGGKGGDGRGFRAHASTHPVVWDRPAQGLWLLRIITVRMGRRPQALHPATLEFSAFARSHTCRGVHSMGHGIMASSGGAAPRRRCVAPPSGAPDAPREPVDWWWSPCRWPLQGRRACCTLNGSPARAKGRTAERQRAGGGD